MTVLDSRSRASFARLAVCKHMPQQQWAIRIGWISPRRQACACYEPSEWKGEMRLDFESTLLRPRRPETFWLPHIYDYAPPPAPKHFQFFLEYTVVRATVMVG